MFKLPLILKSTGRTFLDVWIWIWNNAICNCLNVFEYSFYYTTVKWVKSSFRILEKNVFKSLQILLTCYIHYRDITLWNRNPETSQNWEEFFIVAFLKCKTILILPMGVCRMPLWNYGTLPQLVAITGT